ncbi:MAG TPA: tyrosine-type recombinase/integrase [Candidatus Xenobia bacterium]
MKRAQQILDTVDLTDSQQVRLSRAARYFSAFLEGRPKPWPDDAELVHEWVCAYLVDHHVPSTIILVHFLRLIMDNCRPNPVRVWQTRTGKTPLKDFLPPLKPPPIERVGFVSGLGARFHEFIAYRKRLNRASVNLEYTLRRFDRFVHQHGVNSISGVQVALLEAYRGSLMTLGIHGQYSHLRAVHQFMRYMCRNGETDINGDGIVAVRTGVLRPKMAYIYTLKQIADLLQAVKAPADWNAFTAFTMLHLIYAAGLRLSEPIKLRLRDVNLAHGVIFIERTKFGKSRRIPVGKRALHYLREYARARRLQFGNPTAEERFFVNRLGRAMNPPSVYKEFRRGRRRAGLLNMRGHRPPRVHDLRHYPEQRTMPRV